MRLQIRVLIFLSTSISCALTFSQDLKPTQIFEKNSKSIVLIVAFDNGGNAIAQGSGVVLSNERVVTNCHVISKSILIGVEQKDKRKLAWVATHYPDRDLCVLKVEGAIGEPARLALGKLQAGEIVYALGHPKGLDLTISEGLISGFRSTPKGELIQFSAAISAGSSGGGLFNSSGNLVGVTTSSLRESQNINFAAPVDLLANKINMAVERSSIHSGSGESTVDSVARLGLHAPPIPEFTDTNKRLNYLRWLEHQEEKLKFLNPDSQVRQEFLQMVWYESQRAGVEAELVLSLIENLSQNRKFYVAESGARGYMRIDPRWSRIIGDGDVGKLFHMQTNLRFGCVLLRHQIDKNEGDIAVAVRSYLVEASGLKLGEASLSRLVRSVLARKLALEQ